MALAPSTKTVQDVYNYVTRLFGDEAGVQILMADIITWINMGQREIFIQNPVNKASATIALIADQQEYDPSSLNILQIQSIWINGAPIEHKSFQEAEEYIVSQDTQNVSRGTPVIWWDWAGNILLYPTPSGIASMKVFYLKAATTVSASTDGLSVPDQFFNRLCEYVMAQAYEQDEDSQNSQFKLGQFQQGLNFLAEKEDNVSEKFYPVITELYEDSDF
jgi:hypothetical protein